MTVSVQTGEVQLSPFGWPVAVGEGAPLVAGDQGEGLAAGGDAFGAVLGQHRTLAVAEHEGQVGLTGQPQRLGDADQLPEAGFGVAGPIAQLGDVHGQDELGRGAGVDEFGAAQLDVG